MRYFAIIFFVSTLVSGCTDVVNGVAHLYGYQGDVYASQCTPESLRVGVCLPPGERR